MASGGTWADLLAARTLEAFAVRERDAIRRALSQPIFQPQACRAIAAHLGLPAAAPTQARPPAVPSPRPPPPSVLRQPSPPAPPDSGEAVAHAIAARIKAGDYDSIHALAQEFAPRLVVLGLLRGDSQQETCRRRFQAFCGRHVYGVRIPEGALPAQIRSGRRTGGERR